MSDWKTTAVWMLLAVSFAGMTLGGLAAHGLPFIPALLGVIAAACAVHAPSRQQIMTQVARAFSGPALRSVLIVVGAVMLIQLLPLEMGLLLAGDVLVYVEALTAISLLAAGTRLRPIRAAIIERAVAVVRQLPERRRDAVRAIRALRSGRRDLPGADEPDPAWALA